MGLLDFLGLNGSSSGGEPATSAGTETSAEEKEEKKKREWRDPNGAIKYVCHGAKVQCKFCNPPIADFIVTTETVLLQDKPWATAGDNDGKVNFGFTGLCMHPSQQKPMSPPPPCKGIINLGEWKDTSETIIGSHKALLVKSTIPCMVSGQDITVIHSGQMATLTQISPLKKQIKKVILDAYWIDEHTGKKMRELHEGREIDLYFKTRGYEEGEQATITLKASAGHTFEDGRVEMSVSGIVNSDKIAIARKLTIKYK